MEINRRSFLLGASAAAIIAAVPVSANSIPDWVPEGAVAHFDFVNDRYFCDGMIINRISIFDPVPDGVLELLIKQ